MKSFSSQKSGSDNKRSSVHNSELTEQQLLKEWDFDRFFQGFNERLDQLSVETERSKDPTKNYGDRSSRSFDNPGFEDGESNNAKESPSRISPFKVRTSMTEECKVQEPQAKPIETKRHLFRREHSDFFPGRTNRHSALILDSATSSDPTKGPGITFSFNNGRRGSEIAASIVAGISSGLCGKDTPSKSRFSPGKKPSGEPVLTDWKSGETDSMPHNGGSNWSAVRPRREKTEGDIVLMRAWRRSGSQGEGGGGGHFERKVSFSCLEVSTHVTCNCG